MAQLHLTTKVIPIRTLLLLVVRAVVRFKDRHCLNNKALIRLCDLLDKIDLLIGDRDVALLSLQLDKRGGQTELLLPLLMDKDHISTVVLHEAKRSGNMGDQLGGEPMDNLDNRVGLLLDYLTELNLTIRQIRITLLASLMETSHIPDSELHLLIRECHNLLEVSNTLQAMQSRLRDSQ
jgi:hypothetical protein